ncbi:MAG: heavy metal translocating P-type ATPase [Odoribacteraceae bacterium]|nr:heavy metal translocating P-type ATPase [Odoribacteraceae bacterium]
MERRIKKHFQVTGMGCAGCAVTVERILRARAGVLDVRVNFADATALVVFDPRSETVMGLKQAVESAGYSLSALDDALPGEEERVQQREYRRSRRNAMMAILLAAPVLVIGMFFPGWEAGRWMMILLTLPVFLVPGRGIFTRAALRLRHGRADMDVLVATSAGIAFLASLFLTIWPGYLHHAATGAHLYHEAAAVVIALVLLGRYLEVRARAGAASAIKHLIEMQPQTAIRIAPDGEETEIPAREVHAGDVLVVKPGARVPADGAVTWGNSFVDESMITGEPLPAEKVEGNTVYAGSLNGRGNFHLRVEKEEHDTLLSRVIRLTREAQGSKVPVQRLADRVASIFVPIVACVSVLTFVTWIIAGGAEVFPLALLSSITVLVIACPCALGLATPMAIVAGIGKGALRHILFKDASCLERLSRVDAIVLDKTGTVTTGQPVVTAIEWLAGEERAMILSALERQSGHPLANAVTRALEGKGMVHGGEITRFEEIPGRGITGTVAGEEYVVGNERLLADRGIALPSEALAMREASEARGETVLFFALAFPVTGGQLLAVIAVADEIRESAEPVVRRLQKRGLNVYLLTGDNERAAAAVARRLGIEHFAAGVLPPGKERFIRELQQPGRIVAMVGDGVNDAGALARADVGIAMGKGAGVAIETAGVTLLTPDLHALDTAFTLSRQTLTTIRQNLFWAFIYNVIAIPVAAGVLYPLNGLLLDPAIAAAAMTFSSLSVVLNSLRLKWQAI